MKKLLLILLILFPVSLFAGYGSDVDHALEMENNVTDIGNNPGTWVNGFSVPFDATTFKYGSYSAGVFPATGSISVTLTAQEKTFQIWYYMKTGSIINGQTLMKIMNIGAGNYCTLYFFGTTVGMYIPGYGEIDDSPTMDAWHIAKIIFTGSKVQYWSDGTKRGEYNHATYPNSNLFFIGNSDAGAVGFGGYIDRVIISSSDASAGNEITPIVGSPTFTLTLTITNTLTASPTLTITPTITPTICVLEWTQQTASANYSARVFSDSFYFNGALYVYGGTSKTYTGAVANDECWKSTDNGVTWTELTSSATGTPRYRSASFVFNNKMWIVGGVNAGGTYLGDVWNSTDGITWTEVAATTAFQNRASPACISHGEVFNGKMWIISGQQQSIGPVNDAWYSSNGVDWYAATRNAQFPGFSGGSGTVWTDPNTSTTYLVVGGGATTGPDINYVWFSTDGITWTERGQIWIAGIQHPILFTYNNKIWCLGGSRPGMDIPAYPQIESSVDGWTWTPEYYAPDSTYGTEAGWLEVEYDKVYTGLGSQGSNHTPETVSNAVWEFDLPCFTTATPSVTQTNTPTSTVTPTISQSPTFTPTFTVTPTTTPQWNISISAASNYIILGQAAVITLYGDFTGNSVASLAYEWEGNPKPNPTYVPTRISQASGTDEDGINARWDFFGNDNGAVINGYFSITVSATAFITTSRSLDVGFMSFLGGKEIDYGPELEMTFVVVSATPTPTITPTPYANPNLTTDSTTMILGHSATINLFGVLSGNFLFSEEDFNSSSIYFNEISAVPTAGYDWNYYNQGPKNVTYYEPITITVMPILQGNTTIYGEYDTKLSNGSNFQVFNSLNITIVTETPTYTPTFDTPTQTPIVSPTFTNTPIIINTSTITPSPTQSPTFTITSTATNTFTPTPNFTHTFTPTVSPTYTISPTPIIVTVLPITSTQTSVCTESYLLSGALEYVIEFLPTGYEMHVPVWKNIFGNPFYFEYIVQLSGIPNRSKITGLEIFVKKSNPQTGAWVLQGPNPIWACL